MVFRRLRKRGRDRARSSERRRLGKTFPKDGPTTAKLLRGAVASLTLGTTRSPCSAERRDLLTGDWWSCSKYFFELPFCLVAAIRPVFYIICVFIVGLCLIVY